MDDDVRRYGTLDDGLSMSLEKSELLRALPSGRPLSLEEALCAMTSAIKRCIDESPRLDAEIILGELWSKNSTFLFAHPEAILPDNIWEQARLATIKRCMGWPIAYIVGKRWFYGHCFEVTTDTLIPRPETELLVEEALQCLRADTSPSLDVLDLCTGSGNVAISIALADERCRILAQDISLKSLEVASRNVRNYGLQNRVYLESGDLYERLPIDRKFKVITANPPYIDIEGNVPVETNVVKFEPYGALFAGNDGLEVIRPLIHQAKNWLLPGGTLLVEIGCDQSERVAKIMDEAGLECIRFANDLQNIPRIAIASLVRS